MPQLPDRVTKPLPLFAIATGLFLVTVLPAAGPASAQSFDCQKAYYPDEKTICQDSRLGQLDQELASAYGRWVSKLPKERRDEIQANETLFVQARRRCGHNRDCIEQSYRNRIEEVQGARAEEDRNRPDRARASESRRRSTEREPVAGEQAAGAAANLPQPSERELEPRAKTDASKGPGSDAVSATPVPPVSNPPTRGEATEAVRSAEKDGSAEKVPTKRHHASRAQRLSSSPPEGEAPLSGPKTEHAKRELPLGETNAAAAPAPAKHHPPNRAGPATASGTGPKEPTPAASQPVPESGSTAWVNPPPER